MTTSAVLDWELQRNSIIAASLRKIGVIGEGVTPTSDQYTTGSEALNNLIQTLATEGMPLWKRSVTQLTPVDGTSDYTVSNVWRVLQVMNNETATGIQTELRPYSFYDYRKLPLTTSGPPEIFVFTPGLEDGTLTVWPTPDATFAASYTIDVVYQKEFFIFDTSTDTPDFPAYWTDALVYGLAVRLAPEYGVPIQERQLLMKEYIMYKTSAEGYMDEAVSLFIMPKIK